MIRLFRHYMPYGVPFLALDDLLRIKTTGVHDRDDSVSHQEAA
jgi:hypothetical protein